MALSSEEARRFYETEALRWVISLMPTRGKCPLSGTLLSGKGAGENANRFDLVSRREFCWHGLGKSHVMKTHAAPSLLGRALVMGLVGVNLATAALAGVSDSEAKWKRALNQAWSKLTPEQREELTSEESRWVKWKNTLPDEEREKVTEERTAYILSLQNQDNKETSPAPDVDDAAIMKQLLGRWDFGGSLIELRPDGTYIDPSDPYEAKKWNVQEGVLAMEGRSRTVFFKILSLTNDKLVIQNMHHGHNKATWTRAKQTSQLPNQLSE
jgi:hypothetical protein